MSARAKSPAAATRPERSEEQRPRRARAVRNVRGPGRASQRAWLPRIARTAVPRVAIAVFVLLLLPGYLTTYWLFVITGGVIAIPTMQSLGVITGRTGVMSLCQLSFAMIGAWVAGWCNVHSIPGGFVVWMLVGGLAAVPFGLLIGFPALRLRGVNLAIVTLVFATMMDVVFASKQFPGADTFAFVERPSGFTSDSDYFRFTVILVAAIFVLLFLIDRSRLGASWLELRYSERGAAAHGTNIAQSKLAAFAVSAFLAGIAGVLVVGQTGTTTPAPFTAQASLVAFATAVVIGVRFWHAAASAGIIVSVLPVLLDKIDISSNYFNIVFGVLGVLILARGKGQLGLSEISAARRNAKRVRRILATGHPAGQAEGSGVTHRPTRRATAGKPPALELRGATVRFGAVTAVDDVSVALPKGAVVALLGPNGAGKSTLINFATGFASGTGEVLLGGAPIHRLPPHRRARRGVRRSFQQLRVPPTLTVGQFLVTAAGRRLSAAETDEYLAWFDCPPAHVPIGTMDVGARRVLEVAGLVAGKPPVLLLDEPAAGQGARETELLSRRIVEIPERTGSTVLLVEHDIDLVRAACDSLIVMDFGKVIASGEPDDVLSDPAVVSAYVGTTAPRDPSPIPGSATPERS